MHKRVGHTNQTTTLSLTEDNAKKLNDLTKYFSKIMGGSKIPAAYVFNRAIAELHTRLLVNNNVTRAAGNS